MAAWSGVVEAWVCGGGVIIISFIGSFIGIDPFHAVGMLRLVVGHWAWRDVAPGLGISSKVQMIDGRNPALP